MTTLSSETQQEIDPDIVDIKSPEIRKHFFDWKAKYKNIFLLTIQEQEFVFRALTKAEYKSLIEIQRYAGELVSEERTLEWGLLYPPIKKVDKLPAGSVQSVVLSILDVSGFSDPINVIDGIDSFRAIANTLDEQITAHICKAFPKITPEDTDSFDFPTLMRYLVLAEKILESPLNFQGLKIQLAKAKKKEEQQSSRNPGLAEESFNWTKDLKEIEKRGFSNAPPPGDWDIRNRRKTNN